MSAKKTKISRSSIQVLNDERLTTAKSLNENSGNNFTLNGSGWSSTTPSPPKQINAAIAKKKALKSTQPKEMEHYTLHIQNIKGEKNIGIGETNDQDVIDFVYKDIKEEKDSNVSGGSDVNNLTSDALTVTIDDDDEDDDEENEDDDGETERETGNQNGTRPMDVEHVCGKCYKSFRRFSGLRKHLDFCRFDSKYHLRKAQMLENLEKIEKDAVIMENKDVCFCCGESYDTCHLGHINCPDCPKSFKTQTSYERHIFITHSEENEHPCTICNAKMRSANLLKLHIEQHQNRGKPWACKLCGKDFTRAYHLKRHQKFSSCSAQESDSMSCKVCNKVFFRLDNLRSHLKQHLGQQTNKKPEYRCPICKNCFYSLSTLNIHTRTHTGERPFDCDLCEKKFPSLVALKKHRRYHTGEKPYTCSLCNTSFAVKEVLNRHMKRHTGERPHRCDECGKGFIQATQLRVHLKTHIKNYKCDECDERFKTEKSLQRHMKVHNKRSYAGRWRCTLCPQKFNSVKELQDHMEQGEHEPVKRRTRMKERTDCAICDKNFDSAKNLHFHMLKVHEADPAEILSTKPLKRKTQKSPKNKVQVISTEIISPPKHLKLTNGVGVDGTTRNIDIDEDDDGSIILPNDSTGLIVQEFIINEVSSTTTAAATNNSSTSNRTTKKITTNAIVLNDANTYTVIPLDTEPDDVIEPVNDYKPIRQTTKKTTAKTRTKTTSTVTATAATKTSNELKRQQRNKKSLAESLAEAISMDIDEKDMLDTVPILSEEDMQLKNNVAKLLDMLVDSVTLKKFGWPKQSEESVLCQVIENCGHDLTADESSNYKDCDYATRMREYVKLLFTVVIHNNSIKELLNNYSIDEVIEYVLGNGDDDDDDEDDDVGNDEESDTKDNIDSKTLIAEVK